MKGRKTLVSGLLSMALAVSIVTPAGAAAASTKTAQEGVNLKAFTDVGEQHWAAQALKEWNANGVVTGYADGSFRPQAQITRAEFAVIINRLFGYRGRTETLPQDVQANAWYRDDIAAAIAAGYLGLDSDGRLEPSRPMTRGEVALALSKALKLDGEAGTGPAFGDLGAVNGPEAKAIGVLAAKGYLRGYPDGTIRPEAPVTRAELVSIASRALPVVALAGGTVTPGTVKGSAVIGRAGTVLKDAVIEGDLYLTEAIGEGEAVLDGVKVNGTVYVSGGGSSSIGFKDAGLASVVVDKPGGGVRVYATGSTVVKQVTVRTGAALEETELSGEGFAEVRLAAPAAAVSLRGQFTDVVREAGASVRTALTLAAGTIGRLTMQSPADIVLGAQTTVSSLHLQPAAKGTALSGSGRIAVLNNEADLVTVSGAPASKGSTANLTLGIPAAAVSSSAPAWGGDSSPDTAPTASPSPAASATPAVSPSPAVSASPAASPTPSATPTPAPSPSPSSSPSATPTPAASPSPGVTPPASPSPTVSPVPTDDPWTLVWSDEFDDQTIDPAKWTFDLGDGTDIGNPGWGNNELEWYTNDPKNVKEEDGKLVITARKEAVGGKEYTSSRIKTKGLFSKRYGKFEIRAKAPTGKGYWPAIWMLPEHNTYGVWAASGEIDIMEGWGSRPHTVAGTIHYGSQWPGNIYSGQETELPGGSTIEDFHTYAIEWEPGEIRWYVDGQLFSVKNDWYSLSAGQPAHNAYPAPFDQEFHLLMNLAVGGNFDGNPTPDTVFPKSMEIDYVRVYELTGRPYREPVPPVFAAEPYAEGSKLPLPDGNLVYNSSFTEQRDGDAGMGIPNTAHWVLYKDPGAEASAELETIDGRNYAKVSIAKAGSNPYSVQPQAIVSLAKGRFYKLTFDAKTDTSRSIGVRLTGGENRGFAGYSGTLQAELGSGFQTYEMMFQMKQDSDPAARAEFNMGIDGHPVWIGNVRLEEISGIPFDHDSPKTPLGDGNHLYNGAFQIGEPDRMSYWHVNGVDGAEVKASVSADDRRLKVETASETGGTAEISQQGILLIGGQDYEAAFDAETQREADAWIRLQAHDGTVLAEKQVRLAEGLSRVTAAFADLAVNGTDRQAKFSLRIAGEAGLLYLDNVTLKRTSFYYDPSLVYYPLLNGDFGFGWTGWERLLYEAGGESTAEILDGAAKFAITKTGNQPYSVMLFQNGLKVSQGVDYVVEFDAMSSVPRTITATAENGSYQSSWKETVALTGEPGHYAFEFRQGTNDTLSLKFLLGNVDGGVKEPHEVRIDNVKFYVKNAPAKPQELLADTAGNIAGSPLELMFADNAEWREAVRAVKVNGTALKPEQFTLAEGVLRLDGSVFPHEGTYTIEVEADGYVTAAVRQPVMAADGNLVVNGSFSAGMQGWQNWSGEGGSASWSVLDGAAELSIAAAGGHAWHNQFFQEGIPMTGGLTYELSFKAKSSVPRQIAVEFTGTSAASNQPKFDIGSSWQTYTARFTVGDGSPLKLNYLVGKAMEGDPAANNVPHQLYLDDIIVKTVEAAELSAAPAEASASPAPEASPTPAPESSASPAPEAPVSPAPEAPASPAPEASASPAPGVAPSPAPESSAPPAPETPGTPAPEGPASSSPEPLPALTPAP
ncbi:carbohydrate binding domain-containing protein [Paenibacillus sp. CN-4]|uniref:carbohydrate binding domain-containing protein n=1 Tax=Paenibacillus nanchangensis TaxID=3348343 RepID=UPI00397DC1F1